MGTSVNTIINGLNGELARPVKSAHNDTLTTKNALTTKALSVLEEHAKGEAKIFNNESLSSQGKQQAFRTLGEKDTAPGLKWIRNVVKDMQEKDARLRADFFTITSGIKDVTERMGTYTYLWHALDTLDPNARITRFSQAAERDEVVVMAALLENPFGPMVNDDVKERVLTERAKRLFPQQYEAYEQNEMLLEYMQMLANWIGRWLFGEVGVPIEDIRKSLGDEIADALAVQTTGIPAEASN